MNPITRHIKPIMLVSGALTSTMLYVALFPDQAMQHTFGERLEGPLAELVVRNWGLLVTLVGLMLLHGALQPSARRVALLVAGTSKAAFVTMVLSSGSRFLAHGAGPAVAVDAIMVVLFAIYLATGGRDPGAR